MRRRGDLFTPCGAHTPLTLIGPTRVSYSTRAAHPSRANAARDNRNSGCARLRVSAKFRQIKLVNSDPKHSRKKLRPKKLLLHNFPHTTRPSTMTSNATLGAETRAYKRKRERDACVGEAFPGLLNDIVVTHILRS